MKSLVLDGPYILNKENGSLRHLDRLVPEFHLPDTDPIPIDRFFTIAPPAIRKSRSKTSTIRLPINLVPSSTPQKASAIMTEWHYLEYMASHSVGFDLKNLRYAWSTHGHIFILGEILPPVQGESFWCTKNHPIYIPGGLKPERLLDMEIISSKYLMNVDDILVFTNAENFEIIPGEGFHDLTRSSLRLTSYLSAI